LWSGDSKVFLAMIKSVEDKRNVRYDTTIGSVRVILVVEDSVQHYSFFLPLLYSQIVKQTQMLINEDISESSRRKRMRARPKVIAVHDFDAAWKVFDEYKDYMIGIISDVQYHKDGKMDDQAGVHFLEMVRQQKATLPVLLQSSEPRNRHRAEVLGATFVDKNSSHLLSELKNFIVHQLGFGDFVFRMPGGGEISRVTNIAEFIDALGEVPDESLLYHGRNNHYSGWLMAHGEIDFARRIQPLTVSQFDSIDDVRTYLLKVFNEVQSNTNRGRIVDVREWHVPNRAEIVRLAEGSMGGKGRGLAFLNSFMNMLGIGSRFPEVTVSLPLTAIIGTSEYDDFLESNEIEEELDHLTDDEICSRFLNGALSKKIKARLWELVRVIDVPLAVRSSGLLEDSQACPLAGVYRTLMIPNSSADIRVRYHELCNAVKLVFASVFEKQAREYLAGSRFKPRDEKMAVIIQEMVGRKHVNCFYPEISGVAQSYNFYPTGSLRPDDGIAGVALGLGRMVVDGGQIYRFCPNFPQTDILTSKDLMRNSQKEFWALCFDAPPDAFLEGDHKTLAKLSLADAEKHQVLRYMASRWDLENEMMVPNLSGPGPRILDFAPILKYDQFPLAPILQEVLAMGEEAFGLPVEVEFAANVSPGPLGKKELFILQIRPLAVNKSFMEVPVVRRDSAEPDVFVYSSEALGNGEKLGIQDVVMVDPEKFTTTSTVAVRAEIGELNAALRLEDREYILIGPGRWGSSDRFLGIPALWSDISEAVVIVEMDLKDFRVESSQGTHFFHNLVARNAGYLKIRYNRQEGWLNADLAAKWKVVRRTEHCIHYRVPGSLSVRMDGRNGRAVVTEVPRNGGRGKS
jgi:hypothetical protein